MIPGAPILGNKVICGYTAGPDPEHSNAGGHQGRTQNNRIRGYDVSGGSRKGGGRV